MSFEDFDAPRVGSGLPAPPVPSYQAPPRSYADDIGRLEQQVIANTKQLANSVNQLSSYLNTLGSGRDSQQLRDRIAALVDSTRDIAKSTATDIKELSQRSTRASSEVRARIPKLNKDLQTWLTKFQELSRIYQKKITSVPIPPSSTPTSASRMPVISAEEQARQEEHQALLAAKQNAFLYVENERSFNDSLIREREEGIQEIEQSITEVNDIFRELAAITVQQSSLVDDIESNIENTAHNAAKGVSELQKASELQRSSRSKICCIAVTVAIIAAVAIALVYLGIKFF